MMKGLSGPKLLVLHPSSHKPLNGGTAPPRPPASPFLGSRRRLWLLLFLAFFTCVSLFTAFSTATGREASAAASGGGGGGGGRALPDYVFDALVQYAAGGNSTPSMPAADLRAVARVVRRRAPCNLLVFGLGAETPLWRALNPGGRTVFLDENQYYVSHLEKRHPGLEAYDVVYATTVREFPALLEATRASRSGECRPVQDLLFSECRLAINDLPNHLYDVPWHVVLVDGPSGYTEASPGRMAAIFTAAVMARSRAEDGVVTDVLVHDYERAVERACAREFLCEENREAGTSTPSLAHFVVRGGSAADPAAFCRTPPVAV